MANVSNTPKTPSSIRAAGSSTPIISSSLVPYKKPTDGNKTPGAPSSVRSIRSSISNKSTAVSVLTSGDRDNKASKLKVVTEETFLDEMGKIIERDFFPDMIDVRSQLGGNVASASTTTGSMRSPASTSFRCPSRYSTSSRNGLSMRRRTAKASTILEPKINPNLTLNQFLDSYTSEENHNLYKKLKEDSDKFHRTKFKWMYERKNAMIDSAFSSPSPINALMFHPPGVKTTVPSQLGICYRNTRSLRKQPLTNVASSSKTNAPVELPIMPVATPTPRPGEEASPFMTWGVIKSTPLLLEQPQTPMPLQPPSTPKPIETSTELVGTVISASDTLHS